MSRKPVSGNCALCGIFRERLQRDRVIPGFKGGHYTPENIQWICANCHDDKSRKEMSEAATIRGANPMVRQQRSERAKAQHAAGSLGAPTAETRLKVSIALKGRKVSVEARQKMSEYARARTPEHRQNIGKAFKGKPLSEEHRQKIRDTHTKNLWWTPSGRQKFGEKIKALWAEGRYDFHKEPKKDKGSSEVKCQ